MKGLSQLNQFRLRSSAASSKVHVGYGIRRYNTSNHIHTCASLHSLPAAPQRSFNTSTASQASPALQSSKNSSSAANVALTSMSPSIAAVAPPHQTARYWAASSAATTALRSPGLANANSRSFSSLLQQQVSEYARQPQQGVTVHQLLSVGPKPSKEALLQSAKFLYKELPIRLAKRVRELESLPYGLSQMPPVIKVRSWYEESFRQLLSHPPPTNEQDELSFTELLEIIYNRHADVVPTLAQGVLQMKKELGASGNDVVNQCPFLQDFLNRFHTSRIGIRLLISQHIAIHHPVNGYIGTIATNISPIDVIQDAISDAARICDRQYGWAPEVELIGDQSCVLNFVPNHLHHMVFELMKNSMRAVLEFHGSKNYDAPPIQVVLTDDDREFSIKISDQGGGIPRKDMPRIWSYLYTTNSVSTEELLNQISGNGSTSSKKKKAEEVVDAAMGHPTNAVGPAGDSSTPMSGFGYGLPISRLHATYFGGDLNVVSVQGYGTDVYLYLSKLGDHNLFLE